ncbi:MAG TPA: CYTH domain-containing protein [Gemmatimonadaceae bacterium]|nr:CYTH domain-containing protein [Gemmatimonadaceae bacterium]
MREVELKSLVPDPARTIAALGAAGAVQTLDGALRDRRYDTAERTLLAKDHVLRIREFAGADATTATLDWKGPTSYADGYKVREEISAAIGDARVFAQLLEGLGYVVIREIDRHISQFEIHGATVRIEVYPRMDALVEVEGEPAAIEAAIAATGLPRAGFTTERLQDFVTRFESGGRRAALSERELAGDYRYAANA